MNTIITIENGKLINEDGKICDAIHDDVNGWTVQSLSDGIHAWVDRSYKTAGDVNFDYHISNKGSELVFINGIMKTARRALKKFGREFSAIQLPR